MSEFITLQVLVLAVKMAALLVDQHWCVCVCVCVCVCMCMIEHTWHSGIDCSAHRLTERHPANRVAAHHLPSNVSANQEDASGCEGWGGT